jgi:hypothetical protein
MNYTLHSKQWKNDILLTGDIAINPTSNLALMCAIANDYQQKANRDGRAEAYQVRNETGRLVYWTACKQSSL